MILLSSNIYLNNKQFNKIHNFQDIILTINLPILVGVNDKHKLILSLCLVKSW